MRIVAVISIVLGIFYLYLPPSQGMIDAMNTTVGKNMVDVVCIGSSHVYTGINPVQLYEEHGIAGYDIACGAQAPWQSYYYIKAVNRYQNPRLLILDMYMFGGDDREVFADARTADNLLHYPFSIDKLQAIMASDRISTLNILFVFPYTYDNYDDFNGFTTKKIASWTNVAMGYFPSFEAEPKKELVDANTVNVSRPIDKKREKYLRMSIEYCQKHDMDILLANTPYPETAGSRQMYFRYIQEIADEYGVAFVNGCLYATEIGMDYETDVFNEGHLNHYGVTKYTKWLGEYLSERYDLPDHGGEEAYQVYEEGIEYLQKRISEESNCNVE